MANPVQHKDVTYGTVQNPTAQFSNPTVVNNRCLVGTCDGTGTVTVTSVTDNGSTPNTYNADNPNTTSAAIGNADIRSANIGTNPSSGNLIVTVHLSATSGGTSNDIFIQEISGHSTAANAVDASGTNTVLTTQTAQSVTTSGSSSAANEYGFCLEIAGGNVTSYAGASGTVVDDGNTSTNNAGGHKLSVGGGTETHNITTGSAQTYIMISVFYKLLAAAAPARPIRSTLQAVKRASVY